MQAFGKDAKSLNGMHGIFVGLGEIIGGLGFGILGHVMVKRGRDPVVILGFVCNVVAFFLAFLNLPLSAPLMHPPDVQDPAFISSNAYLAIFTSFLFGFGDACYNTQIYSIIGAIYKDDSAPAFALFKFIQSFSAAIAFFYSGYLMLQVIQINLFIYVLYFSKESFTKKNVKLKTNLFVSSGNSLSL